MAETEQTIEATGTDVQAAIAAGLSRLGIDRDAVEIEVLDQGSRGMLGIGARDARVRMTVKPRPAPPPPAEPTEPEVEAEVEMETAAEPAEPVLEDEAEIAKAAMEELLAFMEMEEAQVSVRWAEPAPGEEDPPLVVDVRGPGTDVLIGPRGKTLAALQRITRLIVGQELESRLHLVVDVGSFKARREKSLHRLAQRLAEQALHTDRTVALEPMPPHERRIIHLALRDHPHVRTKSIGEGDRRKVTIIPRH